MPEAKTIKDLASGKMYIPVPVSTLQVDTVTDFDLYILPGDETSPVLYRNKDLSFCEETCHRLSENRVIVLYVDAKQEDTYRRYTERHLGQLLSDPDIDLETKSTVLYSSARGLVKDVLEEPRSGDVLERSGSFVESTTDYMLTENKALESLMKVTSFDYYTYTHSVNVFVFGVSLAQRIGMDAETLKRFGMGALLHDIGKSRIDASIINCRGKLSTEQWDIMRQHPRFGYDILEQQGVTDEMTLDITLHHHEKLTGTGYPDGLKNGAISPLVRCSTIADVFDALTTRRSYKNAMRSYPALKLIQDEMPHEVDKELFRSFVMMIGNPSA